MANFITGVRAEQPSETGSHLQVLFRFSSLFIPTTSCNMMRRCNGSSLQMISNLSDCNERKQLGYILLLRSRSVGVRGVFCNLRRLQRKGRHGPARISQPYWIFKKFTYLFWVRACLLSWDYVSWMLLLLSLTWSAPLWSGAADVCSLVPRGPQPNWSQSWSQLKKRKKTEKKRRVEGLTLRISSLLAHALDLIGHLLTSHFPYMHPDQ